MRWPEIAGVRGHVRDIVSLCGRREIAQLHVFDHALTKRCHRLLLKNGMGLLAQELKAHLEINLIQYFSGAARNVRAGEADYLEAVSLTGRCLTN